MNIDIGVTAAYRAHRAREIARGQPLVRRGRDNVGGGNCPGDRPSRRWTGRLPATTTQEGKDPSIHPALREMNVGSYGGRRQGREGQAVADRTSAEGRR